MAAFLLWPWTHHVPESVAIGALKPNISFLACFAGCLLCNTNWNTSTIFTTFILKYGHWARQEDTHAPYNHTCGWCSVSKQPNVHIFDNWSRGANMRTCIPSNTHIHAHKHQSQNGIRKLLEIHSNIPYQEYSHQGTQSGFTHTYFQSTDEHGGTEC